MRILLVEDERRMTQALCEILKRENYDVDSCTNGCDGLEAIESNIYDLVILDIMLPGLDGYEIVKKMRSQSITTPVLMLTAKTELDDTVYGLDCGADDYMTKPFMSKELLARVRALLRRSAKIADNSISFGDISISRDTMTLTCVNSKEDLRLSEKEFNILEYFIVNQGRILTREQLAVKIWGYDNESEYNNVEVYISFTRKKLSFVNSKVTIKSIRRVGYEMRYDHV
ncbi:MAG: response regulator transcription factor [Eubacterium sp.]|nr:response regulator transcription factor [Eubacterium sp.]